MGPYDAELALSSLVSDHCPLLLVGNTDAKKYNGFRFEVFWPNVQGYQEVVVRITGVSDPRGGGGE